MPGSRFRSKVGKTNLSKIARKFNKFQRHGDAESKEDYEYKQSCVLPDASKSLEKVKKVQFWKNFIKIYSVHFIIDFIINFVVYIKLVF